eukprot:gene15921-17522_t
MAASGRQIFRYSAYFARIKQSNVTDCVSKSLIRRAHSALATREVNESHEEEGNSILENGDYFNVKKLVQLKELFDARVHLGHHEGCWNPLMKPYIYGTRAHHHIIDLNKTVKHLQLALNVLSHIVYQNGIVLFLNSHPRFEHIVQKTARQAGEYYITQKWRGGTLTNARKMLGNIRSPDLMIASNLNTLGPNLLPLREAAMCNIPTIGIVDTDCDPRLLTYSIPGNDDTPDSMELYLRLFQTAILNAKEKRNEDISNSVSTLS